VDAADFTRFPQLDVHADFQAGAEFFDQTEWAEVYIGWEKADGMMPMRKLFDAGTSITFSSDWTVNPINPLVAISNSLRMKSTKGLPDIHTAIRAATINGAEALGLESITGSIEVGKSADLVVLDKNIVNSSHHGIEQSTVLMTMLQGEIVYEEGSLPLY
ncbi:MAG: amidohydrolase family protein, partial [Pseudomonadota bacterium]